MTVDSAPQNATVPQETVFAIESLLSGTSAGDYEVLRVLSSHLATTTLRVRHRTTGELAELRFVLNPSYSIANLTSVHPDLADSTSLQTSSQTQGVEEAMRLWRQNVTTWTRLLRPLLEMGAHPHIQRLLDFGEAEAGFYVLLDNVEGRTLRQVLEAEGARTLEWTLTLCAQIAPAMDFAAAHHLCHGDLTPDNILLSDVLTEGSVNRPGAMRGHSQSETSVIVRLRNFGLSGLQPRAVSAYMSPEQAAGREGDARSDIYALGALLYTCLSGHPPFNARSRDELCHKVRTTSPLPLIGQPSWVCDIIARAKQRAPADRYRVAVDIVTDLTFQRSPASFQLDAHQTDYDLGRFMPALALQAEGAQPPSTKTEAKTPKNKKQKDKTQEESSTANTNEKSIEKPVGAIRLARMMTALRNPITFLRHPQVDPNADMNEDMIIASDGLPIHGLLGRFNRFMALQEYVFLDENDQSWRGWRGRLRCLGIRLPAPSPRKPSASSLWLRDVKFQLPAWATQRLKPLQRGARIAVPLTLLALCLHAAQRVEQHGKAWVSHSEGHATVLREDKQTVPVQLQRDDILDGLIPRIISTDKNHPLTLELVGSRLQMEPNSSLRITQMTYYNGARQRRMELLNGQIQAAIETETEAEAETNQTGHYEIACEDIVVQPLPPDTSTIPIETSTILALSMQPNGVLVRVARGKARITAQGTYQYLKGGQQLLTQPGKPMMPPSPIPSEDKQYLAARFPQFSSDAQNSLLTHWLNLYTEAENKTLPVVDQAMTLLKHLPGSQSVLNETEAYATAKFSLDAIYGVLEEEKPATLDLHLQDVGPDEKARQSWLKNFADRSLVAYRRFENGSCILLARENNEKQTLLKWEDGQVKRVPEAEEAYEIRRAREK